MMSVEETSWVEKIGKPAMSSIREMVAALECDYDRLQELKDERDGWTLEGEADSCEDPANDIERPDGTTPRQTAWAAENPEDVA